MDDTDEPLVDEFWALSRRLRAMAREALAEWDVTPSQARALGVLRRHGPLRLGDLAEHLRIVPRSATEVVDALEAKGLARRSADPSDRRATLVSLTDRGIELGEEVRRARGIESERLLERLSATDRAHLGRILRRLLDD
jgi:DNA-binding MarR family transcriptional regulator